MPVLELTLLIPNRKPEQVFDFCLRDLNFPKIFPKRVTLRGDIDSGSLCIADRQRLGFLHFLRAKRTVIVREVGTHTIIDEMLKGPMASFRHEQRVAAGDGGTLYTDRVTYAAIGGAPVEWMLVNRYLGRTFTARHRNMLRLLG
ncbi:hypothetical protein QF019_002214 [Pseudomonas frederiksbergensis]|uniref:polyketide cyclase n=1 Tax=Pseudomonas frederiksbergensis TaxID=104087 RepID=UPI003D190C12